MSALRLRIDKYIEGDIAPEVFAKIYRLDESGAQRAPGYAPLSELIPVTHRPEQAKTINLEPGRYYVESMLPSGEILADSVELVSGPPQDLVLRAEDSPHEWLSWQHLVGNVQPIEAEERALRRSRRRTMRIYVGNLSKKTSSQELKDLFSQAGKVERVEIVEDRGTRHSRNFGFVEMATEEEGRTAIEQFDARKVGGRTLTVQEAQPREYRGAGTGVQPTVEMEPPTPASPAREVTTWRPIQVLNHPHPSLVSGESDGGLGWSWLAGLLLKMPEDLICSLNENKASLDIPAYSSDSAHAVYRVSWSQASSGAVPLSGNGVSPAPRHFVVVPLRRCVELVSLPIPWNVVTTDREADIEIVIQEPGAAGRFCTAATARDERLGMLVGYLSLGALPTARQMAETAKTMLYYKFENPFAAVAGAYALVGTARQASSEDWHEWVRNLMNKFPHIPDSAIQWGQLRLRMRRDSADLREAREAFKLAYRRGLPFYSMGMRWLLDGLEWIAPDDEEAEEMLKNVRQIAWRTHYQQPFTIVWLGRERSV